MILVMTQRERERDTARFVLYSCRLLVFRSSNPGSEGYCANSNGVCISVSDAWHFRH